MLTQPKLSILAEALMLTGVEEALMSPAVRVALFAPSDAAFGRVFDRLGISKVSS